MSSRSPAQQRLRHLAPLSLLFALLMVGGLYWFTPTPAQAVSTTLVISQFQVAGGTAADEFVELHNVSNTQIDLNGHRLVYRSASGTSDVAITNWITSTIIPAGGYYLIAHAAGYDDSAIPADRTFNLGATGSFAAAGGGFAIRIGDTNSGPIVDSVAYGTASATHAFVETAVTTAPAANTSKARATNGCQDTDKNNEDFVTVNPSTPRNSGTTPILCTAAPGDAAPIVSSTTPAGNATNVALNADITINFSEAVTVTASTFQISCGLSGTHTYSQSGSGQAYTLNPDSDFVSGETCTVTVVANQVFDTDTDDPPNTMAMNHVFSFTTTPPTMVCGDPATGIFTIQGTDDTSSYDGSVVAIEGVVVADFQGAGTVGMGGFNVQEEGTGDSNPLTSDGIFVFDTSSFVVDVQVGDLVRVRGTVDEFNGLTEITNVGSNVVVCTDNFGPVSPTALDLPEDFNGELEQYEGMLVTFPEELTVAQNFFQGRYGQVTLSSEGRLYQPTNLYEAGSAEAIALADLNARRLLVLDDARSGQNPNPIPYIGADNTLRAGDTTTGLTGVIDYGPINSDTSIRDYRLQPTITPTFQRENPRTAAPEEVGGTVRVASFNVLNYFNGNGTNQEGAAGGFPTSRGADTLVEFNRQRVKIINAIIALDADIIGLMEMENDGTGSASAIQDLVNGLNAATEPGTYAFIAEPFPGTDAIKVAMIYRPGIVTPVGAAVNDTDPVHNRPPLAQTFTVNGETFTVIVNHFKSKGSCPASAADPNADQGDGQGCWNALRVEQAEALRTFATARQTAVGDSDVLVIGDLNAYGEEDPIVYLESNGFIDEIEKLVGPTAYSYIFDGMSGYLDHALATTSLDPKVTGVTEWHINADEPSVIDYNTEFKPQDLYTPTPYKSSDHDPVLVGLAVPGDLGGSTKQASATDIREGEEIEYTITLDGGLLGASGVMVTDTIPAGTDYVAGSVSTSGGTVAATYDSVNDRILYGPADLDREEEVTITFSVLVTAESGTITNEATITASDAPGETVEDTTEVFGNTAGSDDFYAFRDSTETGGPTYNFQNISTVPTATLLLGSDTGESEALAVLPFTFNYYDRETNALCVGANGAIIVVPLGTLTCDGFDVPAQNMPMADAPSYFIAPFWDNLGSTPGAVYYAFFGTTPGSRYAVIQWEERNHAETENTVTFQVIIFDSGDIRFQYEDVELGDPELSYGGSATVGIKGNTIQYSYNQPVLRDSLAIAFDFDPLGVQLAGFSARQDGNTVVLNWETMAEIGNAGFNLYRATDANSPGTQLNDALIASQGPDSSEGFSYQWVDTDVAQGTTYYYWLEAVDFEGHATRHGPATVTVNTPTAVTVAALDAAPTQPNGAFLAAMVLLAATGTVLVWRRRR
jgi:hypothetical protein